MFPFFFVCFLFLVLNFRLLGLVGLRSHLFYCFARSLSPSLMHASIGLRIEGRSADESTSRQNGGGLGGPVAVVVGVLLVGYLPPLGKGKGNIRKIRYPGGSEYLRAAVRYADAMGPSWVEPSFSKIFATRYGPPSGVRIWCPDILTSYVVSVPKMVCFFEVAFENGLQFPLHPFIKSVLQHFNVCPSQLSPNF